MSGSRACDVGDDRIRRRPCQGGGLHGRRWWRGERRPWTSHAKEGSRITIQAQKIDPEHREGRESLQGRRSGKDLGTGARIGRVGMSAPRMWKRRGSRGRRRGWARRAAPVPSSTPPRMPCGGFPLFSSRQCATPRSATTTMACPR